MKNSHNIRKTWTILLLFILFAMTLGFLIGKVVDAGITGAMIMFILASCYAVFAYFSSGKLILRALKAKRVVKEQNLHMYQKIAELAGECNLPPPELYFINDSAMNILSLGRNVKTAKIVLTTALIEKLTSSEVEAVFAHELAHIKSHDTTVGEITVTIVGLFPFYAEVLRRKSKLFLPLSIVLSLFSPLSSLLVHLVLSPKREFEADATGVLLTRYPQGLYAALKKLGTQHDRLKHNLRALAHLWIVDPSQTGQGNHTVMLSVTHPKLEERLMILQSL